MRQFQSSDRISEELMKYTWWWHTLWIYWQNIERTHVYTYMPHQSMPLRRNDIRNGAAHALLPRCSSIHPFRRSDFRTLSFGSSENDIEHVLLQRIFEQDWFRYWTLPNTLWIVLSWAHGAWAFIAKCDWHNKLASKHRVERTQNRFSYTQFN